MSYRIPVFILLVAILSTVFAPLSYAKSTDDSLNEVFSMDRKILGMQKTMDFLQVLAEKKGDIKLANQIAQQSSIYFKRNKQLHDVPVQKNRGIQREKVKEYLHSQNGNLKKVQDEYEQQIASYWKQLLPSMTSSETPTQTSMFRSMGTVMATTSVVDPFEPNNSEAESYPITVGNLYTSKLSSSTDQDFYSFNSGVLSGSLTISLSVPADKDYDLLVMEAPSIVVGFSMNSQLGAEETVTFQVKPNTIYYIAVYSFNRHFSTTASYSLSLSKVSAVLNLTSPIDISLPTGEVPAYRFTAPVTGTYRFFTGPYGGFGAPFDTFMTIFSDEQMDKLVGFNDEAQDGTLFSEMKVPMTKGLTYYVYVSPIDQEAGVHARLTAALDANAAVTSPLLHESSANDGSITEKQIITLSNGTFTSDVASGVTVNQFPAGLQPVITRNSDTQLTVQFTGKAATHESKHSVDGITITIAKEKVVGAVSALVTNDFGFAFTDTDGITTSAPQDINLATGQKKILKLTAPFSGPYELSTTYYGGSTSEGTSNTVLGLYEDFGQTRLLSSNDDGDKPPFSKLSVSLKSGQDYYVVLSGAGSGSVHARLSVRYLGVEYVYNAKGQLMQTKQNGIILSEWIYDGNGNVIQKIVHE